MVSQRQKRADTNVCFVLAPFKEPFNEYYKKVIVPAIQKTGLKPLRADEIYGVRPIMHDVWTGIITSELVIAELTGRNPNVLYELGITHALGKPAILITQTMDDVPFDLKHLRCIVYDTAGAAWSKQLKSKLVSTIIEVIDTAPAAKRSEVKEIDMAPPPIKTADSLENLRADNGVHMLDDFDNDLPLSELPNGVYGFEVPWLLNTDSTGVVGGTGAERFSPSQRRGGTAIMEVHKTYEGQIYIIGYVSPDDLKQLCNVNRRSPIKMRLMFDPYENYSNVVAIPVERIKFSRHRSVNVGYICDMEVL